MDSPEQSRSYTKWEADDGSDAKTDRAGDNGEWDGTEKRKHRSGKLKKSGNGEDLEGIDSSTRRKSNGERSEGRRKSGGSSRAESDEEDEDYDSRKESRSKPAKKKQEESSLDKLSSWYRDGEAENKQSRGGDDGERRKSGSRNVEREGSRSRSKSKELDGGEVEKAVERGDSKYSDRRESGREKGHGSSEPTRSSRRRWDEESNLERVDSRSGNKASDSKYESPRAKSASRSEIGESRSRGLDGSDKGIKGSSREEKKDDSERSKSKGRPELVEEGGKGSPIPRDERSTREKSEKEKQQRSSVREVSESRERSLHTDEDGNASWIKDKGVRESGNRSGTPERSGRRQHDSDHDMDYERSYKRKEIEKDGYKDDRSKGRDENWSERNRDREGSKESWKRRQTSSNDKETKNEDASYERGRDWEIPRHGRERGDNERPHGRVGNRKDGNRSEAVKTSSNFGISNENYDVIEIQTKPLDYGRTESGSSNFSRRFETNQQSDTKPSSNDEDWSYPQDDRSRRPDYGSGPPNEDSKERYPDDSSAGRDQNSRRDDSDFHGGKGRGQKAIMSGRGGMNSSAGSQTSYGSQDQGSFNRASIQGMKGNNRLGRGGRGRPSGREGPQVAIPLPIMASPFGPLGMPPPGPMQSLNPSMSPAPGPSMSPGVFLPPFSPPVWPGARGVDLNMLAVQPGPPGPRFPPNIASPANPAMYFNPSGPGRGGPPNMSGPGFNSSGPMGRGNMGDKTPGGWAPPKSTGPAGKAPSRGEQNDYSQNFVDTGMRPQNFIRELELTNVVEDYPKLRELIQKKDEIVAKSASPPMYYQSDLKEFELSPDFFGTKFDVILVDPPWEEYVHRAPGVADHMEYWTFEEIMNLKIEAIADTPSFIFLWVGDGVGLEQGRQCLKKWGFRRCEDICWVKTNKNNAAPGLRHDSHTLFQHSKEHCLMGIKGTVRRSTDGHIIHANIDTDVIIAEEPPYGSTQKPEDMYRIIEHFALGRRRLELFGEDHNIRSGWLTVGKDLSSSNFNSEAYTRSFSDKDGKVWQGGGGRNPPPEAPHLVVTTPEIESLRPKSPMKNQQQLQNQASASISLTTANSSNRRTASSPQNPNTLGPNPAQETNSNAAVNAASSSWVAPMEIFKGNGPPDDKVFDMYAFGGGSSSRGNTEFVDFEAHRQINLL